MQLSDVKDEVEPHLPREKLTRKFAVLWVRLNATEAVAKDQPPLTKGIHDNELHHDGRDIDREELNDNDRMNQQRAIRHLRNGYPTGGVLNQDDLGLGGLVVLLPNCAGDFKAVQWFGSLRAVDLQCHRRLIHWLHANQ
jgi:hypothetical protein